MTKVRKDDKGLFVIAGGYVARPGRIRGYDHAYRMDDGGLQEGDTVKARHTPGTTITVVTLPDGRKTRWCHEYEHERSGPALMPDPDAVWDDKGLRVFK